ncbi:hypothetical protein EON71_01265, partial [bacterium]
MKNKQGEITSHLHGLFYKILNFLKHEITPIFVFDGKAPQIKGKTLKKRRDMREQATINLKDLKEGDDEYLKNFKESFKPTRYMFESSKKLLELMGIPYIVAPGEADVVCAWLTCRKDSSGHNFVKGICSEDSDMLAHGGIFLFKNMLKSQSEKEKIKVYDLHKALVKLNLTMNQFRDMCVLLGCDNFDPVLGPQTAYKHIQKYGTLEAVAEDLVLKTKYEKLNVECLIEARDYFKSSLKNLDKDKTFILTDDNVKLSKFMHDELLNFMCEMNNFDKTRIIT